MTDMAEVVIWQKPFVLPLRYDCYGAEGVTPEQKEAVQLFFSHLNWIENAKKAVEDYCKKQVLNDEEVKERDNIFSYITPEYFFIKRESNARTALMCDYRYDPEHGLAIVFERDGKITVGSQDIIL